VGRLVATRPTAAAGFFLFWHASPIEGGEFHPVKLADNQFVLGLGSDFAEKKSLDSLETCVLIIAR
jgi:hypothetical protein